MDQASHHLAICNDPGDDALRLAYADWLQASGHPDRAEWIRASCQYARIPYGDARWNAAGQRVRDAFRKCTPAWWESLSNITQENDRGMFRFIVGNSGSSRSPTAFKRLGKVAWLGTAVSEGWLQRLELEYLNEELLQVVVKWKEPASRVPLFVRPAPQIEDNELRQLLHLRQLEGLDLETHVLRLPVVMELSSFPALRDLRIEFRLVEAGTVDAVLAQLTKMPNLHRLHLKGHERLDYGNRPNDADLLCFRNAASLRRLYLSASPAVTDAGIAELQRARPTLIVERR